MIASRVIAVSKKIIKPSSPTPFSLRRHNLSMGDHITTPAYCPIAAFYPKPANYKISQISEILENSLSKLLASYYPFSGRINDNKTHVHCNDIGIEYLNVRITCPMSEILNHTYNDAANIVFQQDLPWSNSLTNRSPLVVQLSHFDCGGIAVSVCLSHKIADGYSLCKFFADWAATARKFDFKPSVLFNASSFLPLNMDDPPAVPNFTPEPGQCVSRMYHFSSSSLVRLKDSILMDSSGVQNPTRVEVATAFLHKCGVVASMENSGLFKPTILNQITNLRPPLPLNTVGNAYSFFGAIAMTEDEIQVPQFVAQLRKAKLHLRQELKDMSPDQLATRALEKIRVDLNILHTREYDAYLFSSLCNFGLYSNVDFGWGRPIRVTLATRPMKNCVIFLDDPTGDGINAIITLTEADMLIFESNKELLEFTSPVVCSLE